MAKGWKMNLAQKKRLSISHLGQVAWNKGKKYPQLCGNKHPNWKGGRSIRPDGYVRLQVQGKSILEHRYIMEKYLGRKLKNKEVVHHKNGNPSDNRIKNLELVNNNSNHMRKHRWNLGGKETITCFNCNKKFVNFKSNKRAFCSRECYAQKQKELGYGQKSYCR